MKQIVDTLNEFLGPIGSSALGHALIGLLILILGLIVVKILTSSLGRALRKLGFLHRRDADGTVTDLVSPLMSLLSAVLTVFVLMGVLQHFGLTDVLAPLREMLSKFGLAVPNIIGAGVVGYAGWVIAKIVSSLVGIGLRNVDLGIAERTGNSELRLAPFGVAFTFGAILLPIVVAALGVLNIPAIVDPASAMIQKLMAAIPNIVGAGIILLVTYFIAKFCIFILNGLLQGMAIDTLPEKLGIQNMFSASFTPTRLIDGAIMFFAMLAASTAAVNMLGIDIISNIFARVLEFGGGILVGGLILVIGNFLSTIAYQKLSAGGATGLANIARIAILGLVLAMGLRSMGLADNIVNMAFGFTIGAVAVAAALAFGLGGRDAAKSVADSWASKLTRN